MNEISVPKQNYLEIVIYYIKNKTLRIQYSHPKL